MNGNALIEGATFLIAVQTVAVCGLNLFNTHLSNRYLGALILVFIFSTKYFLFTYLEQESIRYFLHTFSTAQFYGPVFYLFLLAVAGRAPLGRQLSHLALPLSLLLLSFLRAYGGLFPGEAYIRLVVILEYAMIIGYGWWCWQLFQSGVFEAVKVKRRYWLFFVILYTYLIYNFTDLLMMVFWQPFWESLMPAFFYVDMLLYLLCFCFLILFGLTELNWIRRLVVPASIHLEDGHFQQGYEQFGRELDHLFEQEAIHTDPALNLSMLSARLGVSTVALSDYLKAHRNTSFYELLHDWRVEEFKRKLADPRYAHYGLMGVAYASGFGSKATFYRAFKKKEGLTPRAYVEQQRGF